MSSKPSSTDSRWGRKRPSPDHWKTLSSFLFATSWYLISVRLPFWASAASLTTKDILEEFYDATNGNEWSTNTGWKSQEDICSWYGVQCDGDKDVTRIELDRNKLSGSVPPNFWKLSKLNHVNLRSNLIIDASLEGLATDDKENDPRSPIALLILSENQLSFISGIGYLQETLEYANFNKNQIENTIPEDVFQLTNLRTLYMAFNQLTGNLPTMIGKLTSLTELYAFRNRLTGQLPSELGLLVNCQVLGLGNNMWTGTLPSELNEMVNLRDLSIHQSPTLEEENGMGDEQFQEQDGQSAKSGIGGPLLSFGNLPYLSMLFIDGNLLTGTIPLDFLRHNNNTNEAVTVGLRYNNITGAIPTTLERFEKLDIDLVGNSIESIPPELCEKGGWMGGLVEEYKCNAILCPIGTYSTDGHQLGADSECMPCADGLSFLGAISCSSGGFNQETWELLAGFFLAMGGDKWDQKNGWEVFDGLFDGETFEELEHADIDFCNGWYGILCHEGSPTRLSLPNNNLFGVVPKMIFDVSWSVFDLSDNNVQMEDLTLISKPETLTSLILSNVKIQSVEGIEKLKNLEQLYLDGLSIKGELPDSLFDLTSMKTMHLQHGEFTGPIPSEIGKLSNLERLNLYGNDLTGQLPDALLNLKRIRTLDLSENRFTGSLPSNFENLTNLEMFALHQTQGDLGGSLPAFDTFPLLNGLFLQDNNFEGQIPERFLGGILDKTMEVTVSLASNKLSGSVPLSLAQFDKLIIDLEDNDLSQLDDQLCIHTQWMRGEIGKLQPAFRCNGILCPPGTWNEFGKETAETQCESCPDNAEFYGQTRCGAQQQKSRESDILDLLFAMTGGRYWTKPHDSWLTPGISVCDREGITCTSDNENVLEINLESFGLRGTIPSSIWELSQARRLRFSDNAVSVTFDGIENAESLSILQMSNCHQRNLDGLRLSPRNLSEIHLSANQFEGLIPVELFELTSVTRLFLNNNHFSGLIPPEIGKLTILEELWLGSNKLTGALPTEVGSMRELKVFSVKQNNLSGVIPSEIEQLPNLEELDISNQIGNQFNGQLPAFKFNQRLVALYASNNAFSGNLPVNFLGSVDHGAQITVNLSNNALVGGIPEQWSVFETLDIDLSGNQLTSLPEALCNQNGWNGGRVGLLDTCDAILCPPGSHLEDLGRQVDPLKPCEPCEAGVSSAPFYGARDCLDPHLTKEREILTSFYEATNGTSWLSQRNWLSLKPVCIWYGIVCNERGFVDSIQLEDNLVVSSPEMVREVSKILTLMELKTLDLKGNEIYLDFRVIRRDSTQLEFLRLSGTGLSSMEGISNAVNLRALHATNNKISKIPDELYTMPYLESIFLSFNTISGTISPQVSLLTNVAEFYLFGNSLTGTIPSQIGLMTSLVDFVLSHNSLSGSLPSAVSFLPNLEQFSAYSQEGDRLLTGPVPSFSGAPKLWYFDAADNDLTGPLPDDFLINSMHLNDTITIHLQNNKITGTIPVGLARFSFLDINLAANAIVSIPSELCNITGWMQGYVGEIGNCSAILCPPGSFNQFGRHSPDNSCLPCTQIADVSTFGNTHCEKSSSERDTLEKLFMDTGGEFWENNTNWLSGAPICSWYGVLCGGNVQSNSGITHIKLESNGLSGTLPSMTWTLPTLQSFKMDGNKGLVINLEGIGNAAKSLDSLSLSHVKLTAVHGIGSLSNLKHLSLVGNDLTGTFPEDFLRLSNSLESLYMGSNLFHGTLPSRLGEMSLLQVLNVYNNEFYSTIPMEISRMQSLRSLVLSENIIYGEIPIEMCSMPTLRSFSAERGAKSGPRLSGSLPSFDQAPQLIDLNLKGNELQGSIQSNFLKSSSNARFVGLGDNLLTGIIPSTLGFLTGLDLELRDNEIKEFPDSFCDKLDWSAGAIRTYGCEGFLCPPGTASPIGRAMNETTVCQACPYPEVIPFYGSTSCDGRPSEREILVNLYNALNGDKWYRNDFWVTNADICEWYGIACAFGKIVGINLRGNNLVGLPGSDIFFLRELQILWLYSNPITFSFENIGRATRLQDLRLDATRLHSLHGIGSATSLVSFDARFTELNGPLPEETLRLSNLRVLALSHNNLTGTLPKSFASLKFLLSLRLDSNRLAGTLPAFDDMHFLNHIDVSDNQLTSFIPKTFLTNLWVHSPLELRLSNNLLTGVIPEEFDRFDRLSLSAADNRILGVPLVLCDNSNWNDGDVGNFGCDGILCPPGTFNAFGRRVHGMACYTCPSAIHYGETSCESPSFADSQFKYRRIAVVVCRVVAWMALLIV